MLRDGVFLSHHAAAGPAAISRPEHRRSTAATGIAHEPGTSLRPAILTFSEGNTVMLIMQTLQSLGLLAVVVALGFLAAEIIRNAEKRHIARTSADRVAIDNMFKRDEQPVQRPQLRLVWSTPAPRNDVPYDQMKDLAL
jgi:hypothetical protein